MAVAIERVGGCCFLHFLHAPVIGDDSLEVGVEQLCSGQVDSVQTAEAHAGRERRRLVEQLWIECHLVHAAQFPTAVRHNSGTAGR